MLIYVAVGNGQIFVDICRQDSAVSFILVHAEANLYASQIGQVIEQCNRVLIKFPVHTIRVWAT